MKIRYFPGSPELAEKRFGSKKKKAHATHCQALASPGSRQLICKRSLHYIRTIEFAKHVVCWNRRNDSDDYNPADSNV